MGKQAQNVGKGDGRLYKSVHAGRLAATHPVAGRLLADRQALIDWHNDIAQRLFRPNPLVPDEVSMQRRAKDVSKGSPWFSGYAQNFACAVGTKMSHVEDQLRQRIARRLANCAELSPERRIPKRDVGKPQVPSRKYVHVPMDAEGLVTADDFAAVAALAGRSSSESGDDGDDEVAESKGKRGKLTEGDFAAMVSAVNARPVLLGRDVGMVNTVSYGAILRDREVTADDLRNAVNLKTKDQCRDHILSHWHPCEPLVKDGTPFLRRHSGRNFLNCIADHALHVDRLRSQIDLNYTKLAYFKRLLLKPLGLNDPVERVPDGYRGQPGKPASLIHCDPLVQKLIDKFFRILDLTLKLKELRRDVYRKVSAIKRCWFGWLSTREAEMATALDAVVVRENATFLAVPNDDPKYMGRTFNKMLNNGARAIYEAIASAKLAWLGIPELRIPSPYTSKADLSASSVYETKRRGEDFVDASGKKWHADEHAGLTIAAWLLLRKMSPSTAAAPAAAVEAERISEFL